MIFYLDINIVKHKILFEDKQSLNQQIKFTGHPFIVMGMQRLDCVHGVDQGLSKKRKTIMNVEVY